MYKEDIKTYNLSTDLYAECDSKTGRILNVYTYLPIDRIDFDCNVIKSFRRFTVCKVSVDSSEIAAIFSSTLHKAYPNKQFGRLLYEIKTFITYKEKKTVQGRLATFADKPDIFGFIEVDKSDFSAEIIPPEIKERQCKKAIFNTFLKNNMVQRINDMKESTRFKSTEIGLLSMRNSMNSSGTFVFSDELYDYAIKKGIQAWINENFKDLGIKLNNLEKIKLGNEYARLDVADCDFNIKTEKE